MESESFDRAKSAEWFLYMLGIIQIVVSFLVLTAMMWGWITIFSWFEDHFAAAAINRKKQKQVRIASIMLASFSIVGALLLLALTFEKFS